jgi:hypothetical protein
MRQPEDVARLAAEKYWSRWREELWAPGTGFSFTLDPPLARVIAEAPAAVDRWLREWSHWARLQPGVALRRGEMRVAGLGKQPIVTHLDVADIALLAGLDDATREHWARASRRWERMVGEGDPPVTVKPHLRALVDLVDADFELLLQAVRWFRDNPRSGETIRRVPVMGMHTKWLKRHRRLVIAMLGVQAGLPTQSFDPGSDEVEDLPARELDLLGLKPLPPQVDLLVLDSAIRATLGGLRQVRAPLSEVATLPIRPSGVLVVENQEAALPLTDRVGVVVLHSLGNHLDALEQVPWLPPHNTWYWGDLDRHGFTLLSRARSRHDGLAGVLMNPDVLAKYWHLKTEEEEQRWDGPDPTLTYDEHQALRLLADGDGPYVRIEQERIPIDDVENVLDGVMGVRQGGASSRYGPL